MTIAAYGRFTEAGIKRIAQERGLPVALAKPKVEPTPEPIIEESNVVPIWTPRSDLFRIIDLVARMHGVKLPEVLGPTKPDRVAHARQAAMCAIKEAYPVMSLPKIGRLFGRDHTTCLAAMKKRGFQ